MPDLPTPLIGIGFWRSLLAPTLPDVAWFVDEAWPRQERQLILDYLRQGRPIHYAMGYSWCRFRCDASPVEMGSSDLTDGTYCWPEGLAHYVAAHHLRLPDEFRQHVRQQLAFPHERAAAVPEAHSVQLEWWQQQRGWPTNAQSYLAHSDQEERDYLRRFDRGQLAFAEHEATEAHQLLLRQTVRELRQKHHDASGSL